MHLSRVVSVLIVLCAVAMMSGVSSAADEGNVELNLRDCIDRALKENLNFRSSSLGLRTDELSIVQAEADFDPSLSLTLGRDHSETPTFYEYYSVSSIDSRETNLNATLGQKLSTGATWGVGFYNYLRESNIETEKNYTSMFGFSVTQPLLKGYGSKVARSGIYIARLTQDTTLFDVEDQAVDLVFEVQRAYWNLVYAYQTLRVRELSVEQADTLLAYNRKAMELGTLTQSDVLEAESMLLSRHQDVLDQKRIIHDAEDSLRRIINLTDEEDWRVGIIPVDEPRMIEIEVETAGALKKALALRPDYKIARKQIEYNEFNRDLAKNDMLPSLNLSARYNVHGSGTSYSKDVKDMGDFQQYGWNVGLALSYPFKNRDAKAEVEKREIDIKRADLALRELEKSIMTDIRAAVRNVETLRESVDVAKKNVEVNELKLRIEEERFRNQLSSSYYVLQFQKDLADSRNQYNKAVIDYMMSFNELQKSQGTVLQEFNISIIGLKN